MRDVSQMLFHFIPVESYSRLPIHIFRNSFFGCHDKCPWNGGNTKLLAHVTTPFLERRPFGYEPMHVGFYDLHDEEKHFVSVGTTRSWNWQRGAMLQWLGKKDLIVFNDFREGKNLARIVDTRGVQVHQLDRAICAVDPTGRYGLSYSFERLRIGAPGYEYRYGAAHGEQHPAPYGDGLYLIDFASGRARLLLPLAAIIQFEPRPEFHNSYHFFTHCRFSPSSRRFLFFHRWRQPSGAHASRLLSADMDGREVRVLQLSHPVSHVDWIDATHIIGYRRAKTFGPRYQIIADSSSGDGDGAVPPGLPQRSRTWGRGRFLIAETFPDNLGRQRMYVYDLQGKKSTLLLSLKIPLRYRNEQRCDFHPRWNRHGTEISFDSAHCGIRCQCTIPFSRPAA